MDLETPKSKKMIATTRSFEKPIIKLEDISERIATFTTSCAEKLRKQEKGDGCPPKWCPLEGDDKEGCCIVCEHHVEKGKNASELYCSHKDAWKKS